MKLPRITTIRATCCPTNFHIASCSKMLRKVEVLLLATVVVTTKCSRTGTRSMQATYNATLFRAELQEFIALIIRRFLKIMVTLLSKPGLSLL